MNFQEMKKKFNFGDYQRSTLATLVDKRKGRDETIGCDEIHALNYKQMSSKC